ncbi:MAG: hypothetical protein SAJ37_00455 [Oscillatoria sp. PMC 1068.18]|nr:hypothetical protein [Oscillatoria sp. PMC 1076.18]MEC4987192.1 hypothetical protein [Oscillatoria sp. PMC 1068.18]
MLSTNPCYLPSRGRAKIKYSTQVRHQLARFVTTETVALMFGILPEQI